MGGTPDIDTTVFERYAAQLGVSPEQIAKLKDRFLQVPDVGLDPHRVGADAEAWARVFSTSAYTAAKAMVSGGDGGYENTSEAIHELVTDPTPGGWLHTFLVGVVAAGEAEGRARALETAHEDEDSRVEIGGQMMTQAQHRAATEPFREELEALRALQTAPWAEDERYEALAERQERMAAALEKIASAVSNGNGGKWAAPSLRIETP